MEKNQKSKALNGSSRDRATQYARLVVAGLIVAGPYVRAACHRHLDDLERSSKNAPDFPYCYDEHGAVESIAFFEEVLCLNGGQFEGVPFTLLPWQCFIVGSLFGWKCKGTGYRRFQLAYIETAKGSGKSPLAGGIGIKGLVADKEPRAEIYAAATLKDQAMVLFRDAVAFYNQSPELKKRLIASGGEGKEWKLYHPESKSFFQIISSDKKKSGPRPHIYIADEIHEHPDGTIIGLLEKGFKFRRQPLGIEITNSGHDKTSFCWERHEMCVKVVSGMLHNDRVFAYVCALDPEDSLDADGKPDEHYLHDESLWIKVNPSLDAGIPGYDYIRKQVNDAAGMPSLLASVKRLNFCIWTEAENPWISGEVWNPLNDSGFDRELLNGRRCTAGLDLSATTDLTSLDFIFYPTEADPVKRLVSFFWVPADGLRRRADVDKVPYDVWVKSGYIFTCPGRAISKTQVVQFLFECSQKWDIQGVAYDRARMADLIEFAKKAGIQLAIGKWDKEKRKWNYDSPSGIKMMPFGQEARSMAPAIDKFETFLLNKEIRHDGNPVQTWCMANAVVKDDSDEGYRKISKRRSVGRVDGAVTAVMAAGVMENDEEQKSAYEGLTKEQMIARMTGR